MERTNQIKTKRTTTKHILTLLTTLLLAPLAALTAATTKAESHSPANLLLEAKVSEVAPGVYRTRAGEPERIEPSLVRAPANPDALAAMPKMIGPLSNSFGPIFYGEG